MNRRHSTAATPGGKGGILLGSGRRSTINGLDVLSNHITICHNSAELNKSFRAASEVDDIIMTAPVHELVPSTMHRRKQLLDNSRRSSKSSRELLASTPDDSLFFDPRPKISSRSKSLGGSDWYNYSTKSAGVGADHAVSNAEHQIVRTLNDV